MNKLYRMLEGRRYEKKQIEQDKEDKDVTAGREGRIGSSITILFYFLRFYLFIFTKGGREAEKHQCLVASHVPPSGDQAHMCPDCESNLRPVSFQTSTQSTEPHGAGQYSIFK